MFGLMWMGGLEDVQPRAQLVETSARLTASQALRMVAAFALGLRGRERGVRVAQLGEIGRARLGVQLREQRIVALLLLELHDAALLVGDVAEHDRLRGTGL